MTCPTCQGLGVVADPLVAALRVAIVSAPDERSQVTWSDELDRRRKASAHPRSKNWDVNTCLTCHGIGVV